VDGERINFLIPPGDEEGLQPSWTPAIKSIVRSLLFGSFKFLNF
jgi:hypothetical protein